MTRHSKHDSSQGKMVRYGDYMITDVIISLLKDIVFLTFYTSQNDSQKCMIPFPLVKLRKFDEKLKYVKEMKRM